MSVMTTQVFGLPRGKPLTRADLDKMPEDGHRYELIDGVLIVSPAPRIRHQDVVGNLHLVLRAACTPEFKVLMAPVDVALSDDTVMQPDLLVARRSDFTERDLPMAPALAVEVLSPSTRAFDLLLKKDRLQRAGCKSYWVVDPDVPGVSMWNLADGSYAEAGAATGDELIRAELPFPIEFTPTSLLDL